MATLTEATYYTRRAITFSVVAIIGFFVFKTSFGIIKEIWLKVNPPPPPPPTVAFGKLPVIEFPTQENLPAFTYRLETIEGTLPELSTVAKAYFMPHGGTNLLSLSRAREKASKMGFVGEPTEVSETIYRWEKREETLIVLEMNINNTNFYLRHYFEENPGSLTGANLPDANTAAAEAKKFLKANDYLADDLSNGEAEALFFRYSPPDIVPVTSYSEANLIRVNLFRTDLDEMPIMPPDPQEALVSFLFSSSRERGERMIEAKYIHFPIDRDASATYPLKTVDQAWQELQNNQAFIASQGKTPGNQIVIRQVYLAYFDSREPQNFLQPIFVFEGDYGFLAYVTAIDPEWIEAS